MSKLDRIVRDLCAGLFVGLGLIGAVVYLLSVYYEHSTPPAAQAAKAMLHENTRASNPN